MIIASKSIQIKKRMEARGEAIWNSFDWMMNQNYRIDYFTCHWIWRLTLTCRNRWYFCTMQEYCNAWQQDNTNNGTITRLAIAQVCSRDCKIPKFILQLGQFAQCFSFLNLRWIPKLLLFFNFLFHLTFKSKGWNIGFFLAPSSKFRQTCKSIIKKSILKIWGWRLLSGSARVVWRCRFQRAASIFYAPLSSHSLVWYRLQFSEHHYFVTALTCSGRPLPAAVIFSRVGPTKLGVPEGLGRVKEGSLSCLELALVDRLRMTWLNCGKLLLVWMFICDIADRQDNIKTIHIHCTLSSYSPKQRSRNRCHGMATQTFLNGKDYWWWLEILVQCLVRPSKLWKSHDSNISDLDLTFRTARSLVKCKAN